MKLEEFDKSEDVEDLSMVPLNNILLKLANVVRDRERKNVKCPYLKAEIVIPHEIATTVPQFLSSDWCVAVVFFKKKKKGGK